jgi:hypothetical protein
MDSLSDVDDISFIDVVRDLAATALDADVRQHASAFLKKKQTS